MRERQLTPDEPMPSGDECASCGRELPETGKETDKWNEHGFCNCLCALGHFVRQASNEINNESLAGALTVAYCDTVSAIHRYITSHEEGDRHVN